MCASPLCAYRMCVPDFGLRPRVHNINPWPSRPLPLRIPEGDGARGCFPLLLHRLILVKYILQRAWTLVTSGLLTEHTALLCMPSLYSHMSVYELCTPRGRAEVCVASSRMRVILLTRREGHAPGHGPAALRAWCLKRRAAPQTAAPPPLPPPPPPPPPRARARPLLGSRQSGSSSTCPVTAASPSPWPPPPVTKAASPAQARARVEAPAPLPSPSPSPPPPSPSPLPPPPARPALAAAAGQQAEKRQGQRRLPCGSRPGQRAVAACPRGPGRARAGLLGGASVRAQVDRGGARAPRPCPTALAAAAAARAGHAAAVARVTRAAVCRRACAVDAVRQAEEAPLGSERWRRAAGAAAAAVLMSR
jgi:hypothetical protein